MRSSVALVAALSSIAAAAPAPAPQLPDFNSVFGATNPSLVGPPLNANQQTNVYNQSSAGAKAASAVTAVSGPKATSQVKKRTFVEIGNIISGLTGAWSGGYGNSNKNNAGSWGEGGSYGNGGYGNGGGYGAASSSATNNAGYGGAYTAASSTAIQAAATSTPYNNGGYGGNSGVSSSTSIQPVGYTTSSILIITTPPATSTTIQIPSLTTTATTACTTSPEAGTYCGFINPEDPCAPQPDGYGPKVTPDTVSAFETYQPFHDMALSAQTPSGYANTFKDLNASVSANSYLGLHTLSSYDVAGCSQWCANTTLCTGFNIYIERDPSLNPTSGNTSATDCPSPSSITNYKCTLWGSGVSAAAANNFGGWRGNGFQVVIAGSNGYEKANTTTPATPSGFQPPTSCGSSAINQPSCFVGAKFFPGPYDPQVCASFAVAQTSLNRARAGWFSFYQPCNMFNAYMVTVDGVAKGTYCGLYNKDVGKSYASYTGGWQGSHLWQVETSFTFALSVHDYGFKLW